MQQRSVGDHDGECALALPALIVKAIDEQIVDAITAAVSGRASLLGKAVCDLNYAGDVTDAVVAQRDIGDFALRAQVALASRGEQDGKAGLRESAPTVLHEIRLEEHANTAFQLQMILDDDWIAAAGRGIAGFAFFPEHGAEEMVPANLEVGGIDFGSGAAKEDVLSRGFEKIVEDLESADGDLGVSAAEGRGIGAGAGARDAIESAEVGIDHGDGVRALDHADSLVHLGAVRRMEPVPIEDEVVGAFGGDQSGDVRLGRRGPLYADEAIVVS